ncbi:hypothetical protein [Bacillus pumilus]|uniref:hypothetical protein n=1 Tax=Bacillus pumilus TaxID=1408 RepID=UPI0034D97F50
MIVGGVDEEFRGEGFGVVGDLMACGEVVRKVQGVCWVWGCGGSRRQGLMDGKGGCYDDGIILVGGEE